MKPEYKRNPLKRILCLLIVVTLLATMSIVPAAAKEDLSSFAGQGAYYEYPFQNPDLTVTERVNDLIARLTLDEKISLMHQFSAAVQRLGIPQFRTGTETLHGVSWLGYATVFPQNIGLSMTWDKDLMEEVGTVIGQEVRAYNSVDNRFQGISSWSPVVDLNRDPRTGRASEGMGEDAYLIGMLSTNLSLGMQGTEDDFYLQTIPTLKHLAAYGQEENRTGFSANAGERTLYEYYLKAFEYAISAGTVNSLMTGYNLVNGKPTMTFPEMMEDIYGEWVDGGYEEGQFFVVTDASSPSNLYGANSYYPNNYIGKAAALADSVKNGVVAFTTSDTNTPESRRNLYEAIARGMLTEEEIDDVLFGVLAVRCRAGDLDADPLNPYEQLNKQNALVTEEHSAVALQAAREQVVLLKNEDNILPLDKTGANYAVVGPLVDSNSTDFYAGTYPYVTFIGEEIAKKAGEENVTIKSVKLVQFKIASGNNAGKYLAADGSNNKLVVSDDAEAIETKFYVYEYGYNNSLIRSAATGGYLAMSNAWWNGGQVNVNARAPGFQSENRATQEWATSQNLAIVDGTKYGEAEGIVGLSFAGSSTGLPNGTSNLIRVNGNNVDSAGSIRNSSFNGDCKFEMVEVEGVDMIAATAGDADVAIVAVGDQPHLTSRETNDRKSGDNDNGIADFDDGIDLPLAQENLIKAVAEQNENVVLVIVGSYPFDISDVMNLPSVKGIVYTSHAGQDLGTAVADVLFGDYAPAGRLSQTWYDGLDDLPPIDDYDIIEGERTYMYYQGTPLYEFGYGLTYTTFEYSDISVPGGGSYTPNDIEGSIEVSVKVTNAGDVASDEVVQLYASFDGESQITHPSKSLVGFERIHLAPGASETVTFNVSMSSLAIWDVNSESFYVEPGTYSFTAAPSSSLIGGVTSGVNISGDPIPARDLTKETNAMKYDTFSTGDDKAAEIIPISVMEDDTYGIKSVVEGATVTYKNVAFGDKDGLSLRVSNANEEAGTITVYAGGNQVGVINVPSTGHLQTFINIGNAIDFPAEDGDLTLEFSSAEMGLKWLKQGSVTTATAEDFTINTFSWNRNNDTTLSRLHIAVPAEITQAYSSSTSNVHHKLALEVYSEKNNVVTDAPVWSVTDTDGAPIDYAEIDANGVLTVLEGAPNGTIVAKATMGSVVVSKEIILKHQDVAVNTAADAIIVRSGYDSRPSDISYGPNQYSNFGAIYQEKGSIMLSAMTYPVVNPGREVTFELYGDADCTTTTDLAVLSGTAEVGYIEGQSRGADYASCNQWVEATGQGNGTVYVKATCGDVSYVYELLIEGQGSSSAYGKRIQAELFDDAGNLNGDKSSIRFENVHGDEVGMQMNAIRNGDYALFANLDFGNTTDSINMVMNYLKVSSEPATITFMLDDPSEGTKVGEVTLVGTYDIANENLEYANVVYNWKEVEITLDNIKGVHDLYLVFEISEKVPNTDISSTYGQVAGLLDLGINWMTFEATGESAGDQIATGTLEFLIEKAEALKAEGALTNTIPVVVELFEDALASAKALLQGEEYTQEDVDAAADYLFEMISLVDWKIADKKDLAKAIDLADDIMANIDNYVDAGKTELTEALTAAKEIYDDDNVLQETVDDAFLKLMEAVTDMRLKANKDKLAELIARAEAKNTALYTAESVAVMKSALVDAQSIMQDDTLSTDDQEVVDNAARILEQAIDGLVLLSGEESPDDPDLPSSEPSSDPGSVNTGSTATFIWLIVFLTVGAGCAIFLLRRKEGQNV